MSISQLYDIGLSALNAAQFGLEVTGNNIANVNTPNYCRQRVNYVPGVSVTIGGIPYGTGVSIEGVDRIYDPFLGYQTNNAYGAAEDYALREQIYARIEALLYPSDESNLGALMDDFFNAWQDLSLNPSGSAERTVVLSKAEELAAAFAGVSRSLESETDHLNSLLEGYADEVNRLTEQIAELNQEILRNQGTGSPPNNLLDQRDALVKDLSGYLNVTVVEKETGTVTVLAGGGQALVDDASAYSLELVKNEETAGLYDLFLTGRNITEEIQAGRVNAVLESRETVQGFQDDIDRLAATLIQEVNRIHSAGFDLDGETGRNFFEPLDVSTTASPGNGGGAQFTLQEVTDVASLTLDDYEIRFTDASTFDIVNVTDGTTVASGLAYASGSAIEFEGIRVVLSDTGGPPAAGDTFRVSVTEGAAAEMEVALEDVREIAAAQDPDALPGDNRNALAMADLRNAEVMQAGTTTLGGFYQAVVGEVGARVADAGRMSEAKEVLYESMEAYRQSVSGVSLEEEELRLLLFQNAYQAAARYLEVVGEMMDGLLEL